MSGERAPVEPALRQFDTHLPNLLREMIEGHPSPGPLTRAVNLTIPILRELAARAIELDDPQLHILMLRLSLYEVSASERVEAISRQRERMASPQPEPLAAGVEREDIAKIVYAAMKWAAERAENGKPPAWVERGNSLAQTEARRFAADIEALSACPAPDTAAPAGWKLVPVEPTIEMRAAGRDMLRDLSVEQLCTSDAADTYRAMLAAAPASPPTETSSAGVEVVDWRAVAKAAGEHGVRYRTNKALEAFLTDIRSALQPDTPPEPLASGVDVEAIARAISKGRGLNPEVQNQGPARDGTVDGHWDINSPFGRPYDNRWHYGWRNQVEAAKEVLALLSSAPAQEGRS